MRVEANDVHMRTLLATVLFFAACDVHAEGPYAELRWGAIRLEPMVGAAGASPLASSLPTNEVKTKLRYDDATAFGIEAGYVGVLGTPFKVSLGLDMFRSKLESAELSWLPGTMGGEGSSDPLFLEVGRDTVAAQQLSFDQRVLLMSANIFYEMEKANLKGYVGLGYGMAFIGNADAETGPILHVGARYDIKPIGYVGVRLSRFKSGGPAHGATGLQLDDFELTSLTLSIGREL